MMKKFIFSIDTIIAILAFLVSLGACYYARQTVIQTSEIEKIYLEPNLKLTSNFNLSKVPPHIIVKNEGPVEAVYVTVKLEVYRYSPKFKMFRTSFSNSKCIKNFDSLRPNQAEMIMIPEELIYTDVDFKDPPKLPEADKRAEILGEYFKPAHHNVLGVIINYFKEPDRKKFDRRAYYLMNSKGQWFNSGNRIKNRGNRDEYNEVIKAIRKAIKSAKKNSLTVTNAQYLNYNDVLHTVK